MAASEVCLNVERLAVDRAGGVPLVLLHGFTGDTTTWDRLVPHLGMARGVLAIDLVGHGRSDRPRELAAYAMPAAVEQVVRAAADVGVARAHWLGYSMGGRVALQLALAHPEAVCSLVLVGASPGLDDPGERADRVQADEALAELLEREGIEAFVDLWMAHPLFATQARLGDAHLAQARAQRLRNRPGALAMSLRGMGTGAMWPVWVRLGEISQPALVVAGEEDEKFCRLARAMVARLPDAQALIVPGSGHAAHVEAPDVLGLAVREFLDRVAGV